MRDFLNVHLPQLTNKQRRTVEAWLENKTCSEIAAEENISEPAAHSRLNTALGRLRELAGE